MVFVGGVRQCRGQRLGAWGPLDRPAGQLAMQLGRVAKFPPRTAIPKLDTPLTDSP
jgi:hypothetical protein